MPLAPHLVGLGIRSVEYAGPVRGMPCVENPVGNPGQQRIALFRKCLFQIAHLCRALVDPVGDDMNVRLALSDLLDVGDVVQKFQGGGPVERGRQNGNDDIRRFGDQVLGKFGAQPARSVYHDRVELLVPVADIAFLAPVQRHD